MNNFYPKRIVYILSVLALFILASCANIPLKTIPPPSPTAKLRIYVLPFTVQGNWGTPHEEFVDNTIRRVEEFLDQTGIYEVVTKSDVRAVLGDQSPSKWQMERNGWAFARDTGRALHADYVMIIERGKERGRLGGADVLFTQTIINTETGKIFEAWSMADRIDRWEQNKMMMALKATYRDIFSSAKKDMLETAIKKSERRVLQDKNVAPIQPPPDVPARVDPKPQLAAPEMKKPEPDKHVIAKQEVRTPEPDKTQIAVKQDKAVTVTPKPVDIPAKSEPKPQVPAPEAKKPEPLLQDKKKADTSKPVDVPVRSEPKPQVPAPEAKKLEPLLQDKKKADTSKPVDVPVKSELKPQVPAPERNKPEPPEKGMLKVADKTPVMPGEAVFSGEVRLVIYDLEASENFKTVALILTEVLREELFRLKRFTLVNRETLQQILSEMALQQTGLIDEKQAVKAGKGLAANQIVTGKLGMLGKTYILQAKRIDVETFATLSFASTKFVQGQEEDVLSRLPDLAKSLAGLQQ